MAKAIRELTPMTETVAIMNGKPEDRFTPGWGVKPAGDEEIEQVEKRTKMGRKMTPLGAGTMRPKRR